MPARASEIRTVLARLQAGDAIYVTHAQALAPSFRFVSDGMDVSPDVFAALRRGNLPEAAGHLVPTGDTLFPGDRPLSQTWTWMPARPTGRARKGAAHLSQPSLPL